MKIAVTSAGHDLSSPLDGRFGRTKWFIVVDTADGTWQARTNEQNLQAGQGAGIQAAMNVADMGVSAVITGHVGPKAFKILKAANIGIFLTTAGTVPEALAEMKKGLITELAEADVEGHWA